MQASLSKACEERDFLRSLNEQLLANQKALRSTTEEAKAELSGRDVSIKDLQEQVCLFVQNRCSVKRQSR